MATEEKVKKVGDIEQPEAGEKGPMTDEEFLKTIDWASLINNVNFNKLIERFGLVQQPAVDTAIAKNFSDNFPAGTIIMSKNDSCPDGWTRLSEYDGYLPTIGSAYGLKGTLAHVHSIDPPSTTTDSAGTHNHPITGYVGVQTVNHHHHTTGDSAYESAHTHDDVSTGLDVTGGVSGGGHRHGIDIQTDNQSDDHQHAVDLTSGAASATHWHTIDIGSFDSGSASLLSTVSVVFCVKD